MLQETGETLTGVVFSMSSTLSSAQASGNLDTLLHPPSLDDHKAMFFSVGSMFMITYSMTTARLLHNMALALVASMPVVLKMMAPKQVGHLSLTTAASHFVCDV